ncbi:MAG TPA: ABC transporter permease [Pirellulales bacterium]|jgi:peptide/nickel transport system permease protein|nr:ABC transporter permease [Pirellulales bacterium]
MLTYIVRRLLIGLLTLWLITFLVYGLIRNMPGDPTVAAKGGEDPSRKQDVARYEKLKEFYGLDKPWYVAYWIWLGHTLHGDLGYSDFQHSNVTEAIGGRVGPTLWLSVTSLVLAYLLSVPLGLYSAARSGRLDERVLATLLYMLYSLPSFVAALWLQTFFALKMQGTVFELPLFGMTSDGFGSLSFWGKTIDLSRHLVLPVFCFTYAALAYETRFIKANLHEVLRQDYIRTAKSKGVGPMRILWRHAFRNTLIPFVTSVGLTLPSLLSGAVILEAIFSWPGMGRLLFESITARDYPIIMGLTLLFSVLTLLSQLLADLLYSVVDPRISYS